MKSNKLFGLAALFDTPDQIISAARQTNKAGYQNFDVNTPYPLHGMDNAMGLRPSRLGFVTLFFGFSGVAFILLFMWWAMAQNYPMIIGGKPFFALPALIPITFETAVLLGALSTVFGMIAVFFKLPFNSHPSFDSAYSKAVSSDKYGIIIEAEDKHFDKEKTLSFLKALKPVSIEELYYEERVSYPIFEKKFVIFLVVTFIVGSASTYILLNKMMYITPFNWMMEQDKVTPQEKSTFYADGFGMRKPVDGTVARGFLPYPFKGQVTPKEVLSNPLLPTKDILALGEKKFLTYCSPCHGNHADGDSRLRGQFPNPPTLHSTRAREFSDGMLYHIITNGQNIMPSYASQVAREERWAIVNYIRVLQRAKNANPEDIKAISEESGTNVTE